MALKVIGAGLGRTGTLSLKLALEHLGYGPCYHMLEIMADARNKLPQWIEVVRGNPDWDAIFEGYQATVDYPTATYWRELADFYPDAKVILSTRDAESWFNSVNRTIMSSDHVAQLRDSPMAEFMNAAVYGDFGDRIADREFMVDYYRRRDQSVIDSMPRERLLVHRPGDDWEPLCAFLGVPVPDVPYPRVNSSEDMLGRGVTRRSQGESADPEAGARGYMDTMRDKAFGG